MFLISAVADGGQATFWATECMADIEVLATWAVRSKSNFIQPNMRHRPSLSIED